MKVNRGFLLAMIVLAVLAFVFSYRTGVEYDYDDRDLGHETRQPLGIKHVDEVFASVLPRGYEVVHEGLYSIAHSADSVSAGDSPQWTDFNYLFVSDWGDNMEQSLVEIDEMMRRGATLMVAVNSMYSIDELLAYVGLSYSRDYNMALETEMCDPSDKNCICWTPVSTAAGFNKACYWVPEVYFSGCIVSRDEDDVVDNPKVKPLPLPRYDCIMTSKSKNYDVRGVVRITSDEYPGSIILCAMPRLFTNFAMAHSPEGRMIVMRLMTLISDKPVRRLSDEWSSDDLESPTDVIGMSPAMNAAYVLVIITCLIAMVFTARRRQRVIPVIEPPVNRVMEMTLNVGDLYYRRHDNVDLVMKRYSMFVEGVRRELMVDLEADDRTTIVRELSSASGMPRDEIASLLDDLERVSRQPAIDDRLMMQLINKMDDIEAKLKL